MKTIIAVLVAGIGLVAAQEKVPTRMYWAYTGSKTDISFNIRYWDTNKFTDSLITNLIATNAVFDAFPFELISVTVSNRVTGLEQATGIGTVHRITIPPPRVGPITLPYRTNQ